jgi:hypothetical protein
MFRVGSETGSEFFTSRIRICNYFFGSGSKPLRKMGSGSEENSYGSTTLLTTSDFFQAGAVVKDGVGQYVGTPPNNPFYIRYCDVTVSQAKFPAFLRLLTIPITVHVSLL